MRKNNVILWILVTTRSNFVSISLDQPTLCEIRGQKVINKCHTPGPLDQYCKKEVAHQREAETEQDSI